VIERRTYAPQDRLIAGDYAVAPEPATSIDTVLHPLTCAVVGAADLVMPGNVKDLVDDVRKRAGKVRKIDSWNRLEKDVLLQPAPSLIALVAHQGIGAHGKPVLVLGKTSEISADVVRDEHLRPSPSATPPVALVLGCDTGIADVDFQSFVAAFKHHGAAVVVGTLATVLGMHAAPVSAQLVDRIAAAGASPTSFGEIMRDVRRKALLDGVPMAMSIVAVGDADWAVDGLK
jgi:hypothetical protein